MKDKPSSRRSKRYKHLSIKKLPCAIIDSVIMTTFEAKELINLCNQVGVDLDAQCDDHLTIDHFVYLEVHRHCHQHEAVSKLLQRQLNRLYLSSIKVVRDSTRDQILKVYKKCMQEGTVKDMISLLWAITTDPREELRCFAHSLQYKIRVQSHKALIGN